MTQLHTAIRNGEVSKVADLISGKARPGFRLGYFRGIALVNSKNWDGDTPLHLVISKYSENPSDYQLILSYLLTANADKNITNFFGYNSLHLAAIKGLVRVVRLLLECGAAIDVLTCSKNRDSAVTITTALGYAALHGHDEVIEEIFKFNPRIEGLSGPNTITPLQAAAASGKISTVKLLLSKGANINSVSNLGAFSCRTPLWYAFDYGFKNNNDFTVAKFLLGSGADVNAGRYLYPCLGVMALNIKMRAKADELLSNIIIGMKHKEKIKCLITIDRALYIQYETNKIYVSNPARLFIETERADKPVRYVPNRDFTDLVAEKNVTHTECKSSLRLT
jgi:hypothetical protein